MLNYGFELIMEREIPEINTRARLYRHQKSGARLLSMENADENKVFGVTFRTPPADSTGIAHIMEHAVLCGSRKYPLKEPFVELMKGSLNTFLNAFTYPDKTCYPVASQNLQDFYNLIDVYLDAVFYPLIPSHTLDQEGWHYELEDANQPLTYKGVVFNEMKGAYSSPDNLLGRYAQQSLFPNHTYGVDSGGDPTEIPNLTYTQFKTFHETYYHPSNAWIYFYGDDDPQERLRRMDEVLQAFEARPLDSQIPLQPGLAETRRLVFPYDHGDQAETGQSNSKQGYLVMNWLLPETLHQELALGLNILTHVLIGTPASPLRKALIDSGLGEDLAGVGLENDLRQMYFSTGMKGIDCQPGSTDFERVEALILDQLGHLAAEGIDPETIAASLNTVEFRLRENNTGAFPRGLLLMLRSLTTWLYDGDPTAPLAFEAPLQAIKARLAAGEAYFENLIQRYLLENQNRSTVILQPEAGLRQRQEQAETEKLAAIRFGMTSEQIEQVAKNTHLLKARQETPDTPEALATIPGLKLEDLDRQNKLVPIEATQYLGAEILFHDLFTNGITYLDLGLNLHLLPPEDLPFASLFGRALLEMGTYQEDFVRLTQRIGRSTGGIRPVFTTIARPGQDQDAAWLFLRGKATLAQSAELLSIMHDILLNVNLDNPQRFRQMVLEEKADLEAALAPSGHRLVNTRLRSFFSQAGWVDEQIGGITYLYFLRRLVGEVDQNWPAVLERLQTIRLRLVNRRAMLANLTLDQAGWGQLQPQLSEFLERLPSATPVIQTWPNASAPSDQGLTIPSQVNFVGKGANLFEHGYKLHGSYAVILNYLRTTWLWEKVRVQGGAYGGLCLFNHRSGVLTFLSYRDPNLAATLDIYDQTGQFLRQLDSNRLSQEELTRSIIGAIGDLDAYQLPDAKGYTSLTRYLAGESDAQRQQRREEIFATRLEDFPAFGEVLDRIRHTGRIVVIGPEAAIQTARSQGLALVIEKAL